jgi:transposase
MSAPAESPLPDDLATAHRQIREQAQALRQLQHQLERMQHQLELLLRQRYGKTSEKRDPGQLQLFGDEAVVLPLVEPPPAPEAGTAATRSRGRRPLPAGLPRQQIVHDLAPERRACPECGAERRKIGEETREQLEYVPASLRVLEHVRPKYACPKCKAHVAIAARLPEPIERGLPGPGLLAQVITSKYLDHLPLYRLERIFARQGVALPRSTTCDWMAECAGLLEPVWKAMKARILRSRVIGTDDTPVAVQDHRGKGNKTGRLWAYLGDRDHPFVVYDYTPDRNRDGPEAFLKGYTSGYLQSDAYTVYDLLHARGLVEVGCWAHARRKFHEARTSAPEQAHAALARIGRLYDVEREARAEAARRAAEPVGAEDTRRTLEDELLATWRRERSRPIWESFFAWLDELAAAVLPKSPLGEAVAYARSNRTALGRYLEAPYLAIDNNATERALRPIAVGRNNWLHLGSDAGGRTAAVLLSVVQSCHALQVESWAYLRDVLERVSTHPASRVGELLPDAWTPSQTAEATGRKA